jgi:hypothetical protein
MATSHNPPEHLLGLLSSVEHTVLSVFKEHPQFQDKDIEITYEQFKEFYQQLAKGKEVYEPDSGNSGKQALIENEDIQPNGFPIPNVEALYASAFNYLINSARFWRKQNGPKGYLKFISEML